MVPGRVDHLLLGKLVDGQLQLTLPELDLFLGRKRLEVRLHSEDGREEGHSQDYLSGNFGAS